MREFETIRVDVEDGVGLLTFDRPDAGNAFNIAMTADVDEARWAMERDPDVRVIVVTGEGRSFSTGWDLTEGGGDAFGDAMHEEHNEQLGVDDRSVGERFAFWRMRTPVISAVNGTAIGAGLTFTLLTDIRVFADDARLRFPFTRLNIIPEGGSTWLLSRLVGATRALDLLLTGRWFTGAEAEAWGFATRAVAVADVLPTALDIARDLADYTSPTSVAITKQLVYDALESADRIASMERETRLTWWAGTQPDTIEGVSALMQKRKPAWTATKHGPLPDE